MSFHTRRYSRFFKCGELFSTASTLRLIHDRRNATLPTVTTKGFKRLLTPENSLPSATAAFARLKKGNFCGGAAAWISVVFKVIRRSADARRLCWGCCLMGRTIIINDIHSPERSNIQHEPTRSASYIIASHAQWLMA